MNKFLFYYDWMCPILRNEYDINCPLNIPTLSPVIMIFPALSLQVSGELIEPKIIEEVEHKPFV